jgi:hypothetical protein
MENLLLTKLLPDIAAIQLIRRVYTCKYYMG